MVAAVPAGNLLPQSFNELQERLEKVRDKKFTESPHRDAAEAYVKLLERASSVLTETSLAPAQTLSEGVLSHRLMELEVLRDKTKTAPYYVLAGTSVRRVNNETGAFGAVVSRDSSVPLRQVMVNAASMQSEQPEPSPQAQLAKRLGDRIAELRRNEAKRMREWPTFFLELAGMTKEETMKEEKALDPVCGAELLLSLLEKAANCAPAFDSKSNVNVHVSTCQEELRAIDVNVDWPDPDNSNNKVTAARKRAKDAISRIDFAATSRKIREQIDKLAEDITPYRQVGVLLTGRADLRFSGAVPDGDLFVVAAAADASGKPKFVFVKIGKAVGGTAADLTVTRDTCPLGSAVFQKVQQTR